MTMHINSDTVGSSHVVSLRCLPTCAIFNRMCHHSQTVYNQHHLLFFIWSNGFQRYLRLPFCHVSISLLWFRNTKSHGQHSCLPCISVSLYPWFRGWTYYSYKSFTPDILSPFLVQFLKLPLSLSGFLPPKGLLYVSLFISKTQFERG